MVPLLFTELLTRQMGICTVSFRHLSRVWCRVESLSSLCSQRIHFEGRREREAIPETQTGACGKQPGWEGSSVFKEGPWINWIPKQRLHTANSAADRHLQCSRSVSWKGIFLFAACDGFGGVGGLGRGGEEPPEVHRGTKLDLIMACSSTHSIMLQESWRGIFHKGL